MIILLCASTRAIDSIQMLGKQEGLDIDAPSV